MVGVCGAQLAAGLAERRLELAHRAELTRALARRCFVLARGTERAVGRACGGVGACGAFAAAGGVGVGLFGGKKKSAAAAGWAPLPESEAAEWVRLSLS